MLFAACMAALSALCLPAVAGAACPPVGKEVQDYPLVHDTQKVEIEKELRELLKVNEPISVARLIGKGEAPMACECLSISTKATCWSRKRARSGS
jgi:hypothetical protein